MSEEEVGRWPELRKRGRTRFLLVDSILKRGTFMSAIACLALFERGALEGPLEILFFFILIGLVLGYLEGCIAWWLAKRSYYASRGLGFDSPVSPDDRWHRIDQTFGLAMDGAIVLGILLCVAGWVWKDRVILWSRGATLADSTGLLAYWSFDDCTIQDNSSHGFTGEAHQARCIQGPSGKAIRLIEDGGYLSFPRIMDSVLDEMSMTYCRKFKDGRGWRAEARTISYSDLNETSYANGRIKSIVKLPEDGRFPRGDWEFGRVLDPKTKQMKYSGGAVDELRVFTRKLSDEEVLRLSQICQRNPAPPPLPATQTRPPDAGGAAGRAGS